MLYAVLCYNNEDEVFAWSKEQEGTVMAALGSVALTGVWSSSQTPRRPATENCPGGPNATDRPGLNQPTAR